MRSTEEITKDHNAKSSLIRMLEGNTWRDELKPIEERLKTLKAELREVN